VVSAGPVGRRGERPAQQQAAAEEAEPRAVSGRRAEHPVGMRGCGAARGHVARRKGPVPRGAPYWALPSRPVPRGAPNRAAAVMAPTSSSGGARAGVVHQRTLGEVNLHVALLALGAFAALRQMRRHHPLWLRRVDLDLWGREDAVVSTCMQGRGRWLRRVGLDLLDRERWLERNVLAAAVERGPVLFAHATEEELRTRRAIRCKWRATRLLRRCAQQRPRRRTLFVSEGDTWKDRMPDFSSSLVFSIFQFCRSHDRPSSSLR
jgi:hypothetical protein